VVGLPSETHINFYQVDIEDFDNEVYSYEAKLAMMKKQRSKPRIHAKCVDVCIFRINGMEVFL
jgi:hypothetical protein